jgi:exo-1,4-beta-D-glucosaminidase
MFRRFEFDVSKVALPGKKNSLAVEIVAPGQIPDIQYRTKQLEATTGWDDHNPQPPDLNMGIWRDVYLRATGPVALANPYVSTKLEIPALDMAHLTVSVDVVNKTSDEMRGEVVGTIENVRFSKQVTVSPLNSQTVVFKPEEFKQLNIRNPRVWWPHPLGKQELYTADLSFRMNGNVSDAQKTRFGIREATTYINEEGWRGYRVNGKNVLIRGGAWMTVDMLLRLDRRRYQALVRYAREANLNMLRSEGFSVRETDEFYDICDELGVMVTQQIFGRNIPDEKLAVANIEDMMLRIRNHPSLVHFLGHDETYPTETLDKAYKELIAKYTPERTYQPHSGAFDVKERAQTGGTRTGTRELWTYATPGQYYRGKEDGAWGFAQSGGIGGVVSPMESMRRMMPKEAMWPPFSETWSFHTVIQGGKYFDTMMQAINRRYGDAKNIEDFTSKAEAANYESARGMYESFARNKYSALGITQWKYDAAWPASPTWQYVDWYLIPTAAYYGAKKACEPLHPQYSYDDHSVYVVNSFYKDFKGLKVSAQVLNLDMAEKFARTESVDVGADGKTKAFVIDWPKDLSKTHFLRLKLTDAAGKLVSENLYWLSTVPDVPGTQGYKGAIGGGERGFYISPKSTMDFTGLQQLPAVKLDVASSFKAGTGLVTITNATKTPAFMVRLAVTDGAGGLEVSPAYWEDNYFTLLPGDKKQVKVEFAAADVRGRPVLRVEGWNIKQ